MTPVTAEELIDLDEDSDDDKSPDKYEMFAHMATDALRLLAAFDTVIRQQQVSHLFENTSWLNSATLGDKSRLRLDVCREVLYGHRIAIMFRLTHHRYLHGVSIRDGTSYWYGSGSVVNIQDLDDGQLLKIVQEFVLGYLK